MLTKSSSLHEGFIQGYRPQVMVEVRHPHLLQVRLSLLLVASSYVLLLVQAAAAIIQYVEGVLHLFVAAPNVKDHSINDCLSK